MDSNTWVSIISFLGTAIGTFGGIIAANRLTTYRIEQLEKQVERHNKVIERTYALEKNVSLAFEKLDEHKEHIDSIHQELNKIKE